MTKQSKNIQIHPQRYQSAGSQCEWHEEPIKWNKTH